MAKKNKDSIVIYRGTQFVMEKDENGVRQKKPLAQMLLPSRYIQYDDEGKPTQRIYSLIEEPDPKTGRLIPKPEKIEFINGELVAYMPKDKVLIDYMDDHPNMDTAKNRSRGNKILFERVNMVKEKENSLNEIDMIVNAINLINSSDLVELIEYAKALSIDVSDVEEMIAANMAKGGKGKATLDSLRNKEEVHMMIVDMKRIAKSSPETFIKGLKDPLRGSVAIVKEGIQYNVIAFDQVADQFCWIMGNDRSPIQTIPRGVNYVKWFAQWLTENDSTMTELKSRIDMAKSSVNTE